MISARRHATLSVFERLPRADQVAIAAGSIDRVDAHVLIGGYLAAASALLVRHHKIDHIVKLFADDPSYHGGTHRHAGVRYLILPAQDEPDYDIRGDVVTALRFIGAALRRNGQILVHCHMGVSRSATIVLFYLMLSHGIGLGEAEGRLRLVRPFIQPNAGFRRHLLAADLRRRQRTGDERAERRAPCPGKQLPSALTPSQ